MQNLIGDKWMDSVSKKTTNVVNPATGEIIDTIPASTLIDVDLAVDTAYEAQKKWAKSPTMG